jgi:tetratricopeptide (TPR) repeat protein
MKPAVEAPSAAKPPAPSPRWRKWLFRLAAVVLPTLLLLCALEGLLRLMGYGCPVSFFLTRTVNNQKMLVENRRFGWRFFGPEIARVPYSLFFPKQKPPDTIRIFVFGESAAYGDPDPDYGLPRMLAVLLRERYPGTRFEVINTAMTAINSNVILPIARDAAHQQGDIWVIYMGNNEVVGPFGGGTVFGPGLASLSLIRSVISLKATRTGQFFTDLLGHLGRSQPEPDTWRGMAMFLDHQVRQADPRMNSVYAHFAQNLDDILRVGTDHGAKIVLGTMAVNLKDCAPFASLHRPDFNAAQSNQWEKLYQTGIAAESAGKNADAVESYRQAAQLDDQFADLQFRWAGCCLALGQDDEARRHFLAARDDDTLRFRADSRINQIIRLAAKAHAGHGVVLADAEAATAAQSPHHLPGNELFYEHVHFNFDGNYAVARAIADQVAPLLPDSVKNQPGAIKDWPNVDECALRLGWTDWSEYTSMSSVALALPPFTHQLNHADQLRQFQQRKDELLARMTREHLEQLIEIYTAAANGSPDDWVFPRDLAILKNSLGDMNGAVADWRQFVKLLPTEAYGHFELGFALGKAGQPDEANARFATAFDLDPYSGVKTFVRLADSMAIEEEKQGRYPLAVSAYRQALVFQPDSPETLMGLGELIIAMGRPAEGRQELKTVLQHPPASVEGLTRLGEDCYGQGWTDFAISNFQAALKLDSRDAQANTDLGIALSASGRIVEAGNYFARAVNLEPDSAGFRLNWGMALLKQGRNNEALQQFQQALQLDPTNAAARAGIQQASTPATGRPSENK